MDSLDAALGNKLQRATTMLSNAYQDGKQVTARIRASVRGIQAAGRLNGGGRGSDSELDEPVLMSTLRRG